MGHPPKAMKYITCRVMSFRPWQASCGPLRGLSRLHSGISLILSIPSMSPPASPFHLLRCRMPHSCILFLRSPPILRFRLFPFALLPLLSFILISHPSLSLSLYILCLLVHARHRRPRCHGAPQHTAVPWSRNPTLTLGFHPEII